MKEDKDMAALAKSAGADLRSSASESQRKSEAIWRVCRVIKGDCRHCPASEMIGDERCTRGCYAQAVETLNVVETGNPWRKTEGVRAPWVVLVVADPDQVQP